MLAKQKKMSLANRFRGLLPVVIDVETSGVDPLNNGLLEIAAVTIKMDEKGLLCLDNTYAYHVELFQGAVVDPEALAITGIDPGCPLRYAIPEQQALRRIFAKIRKQLEVTQCQRAVLVGHNAWFDLAFIQAAVKRCGISVSPLHSFTLFDTATLAAVFLGETVLAKAARRANIAFDVTQAHSAIYDAERTAQLFCALVNAHSTIA